MRKALLIPLALTLFSVSSAHAAVSIGPGTELPFDRFSDIVVAPNPGRVFVSGGSGASGIAVLDFAGTLLEVVPAAGAGAMVLHGGTLYVARVDSGSIDAFDAATLVRTHTLPLGLSKPESLAIADDRIWFRYGTCGSRPGIGSVEIDGGAVATYPSSGLPSHCPILASAIGDPRTLLAVDQGVSPTTVYQVHVEGGVLSVTSQARLFDHGNARDLVLTPDGTRFVLATGAPYRFIEYATATLVATGVEYPANPYPNAVAFSSDGTYFAGGTDSVYDPDVHLFMDGDSVEQRYDAGQAGNATLFTRALAFDPEGTKMFIVMDEAYGTRTAFHVLPGTRDSAIPSSVSLVGDTSELLEGQSVRFTGVLESADGEVGHQSVEIVHARPGQPYEHVGFAVTDATGSFSVNESPIGAGRHYFRAVRHGSSAGLGSLSDSVAVDVSVSVLPTTLWFLDYDARGTALTPETIKASLRTVTVDGSSPVAEAEVLFELRAGDEVLESQTAITDEEGVALADMPLDVQPGSYTVRLSFMGSEVLLPSEAEQPFEVQRAEARVQVEDVRAIRGYIADASAVLTDGSGAPLTGRSVGFWVGDDLLGSGQTDRNGRATIHFTAGQDYGQHDLEASVNGDDRYGPAWGYATLTISWEHVFEDQDGLGSIRINTKTRELQARVGSWESFVVSEETMRAIDGPLVAGTLLVDHRGESFTLDGAFDRDDGRFAAALTYRGSVAALRRTEPR